MVQKGLLRPCELRTPSGGGIGGLGDWGVLLIFVASPLQERKKTGEMGGGVVHQLQHSVSSARSQAWVGQGSL